MKRTMFVLAMSALFAAAPAADAKPRLTSQTLIEGEDAAAFGYGCEPATHSVDYRGRARNVESYMPAEGDRLAGPLAYLRDGPRYRLTVTNVAARSGRLTWTVAPDPDECARRGEDWQWHVARREWSVEYKRRVYAIVGVGQSDYRWRTGRGVANLAGLPISRLFAGRLNLRNAARYLGRPKRITGGGPGNTNCIAHWPRLGLKAAFVSFGLDPNCWRRQFQEARISGPAIRKWAVVEGAGPGVPGGTLPPKGPHRGPWAYKWWPYGPVTTQISPSITARYGGSPRRITTFNLWIGAAGD